MNLSLIAVYMVCVFFFSVDVLRWTVSNLRYFDVWPRFKVFLLLKAFVFQCIA